MSDEVHAALRALANPMRLRILEWLVDPAATFPPQDDPPEEVGACLKHIQHKAGVSQSTASQYMATLQRAGLVVSTRRGQWTYYKRDEAAIAAALDALRAQLTPAEAATPP